MKRRTIKTVIRKKINEWLNSISDLTVRKMLEDNIIVTGGCITSMLLNEPVNDFDIYLKTQDAALLAAKYYVGQLPYEDVEFDTDDPERVSIYIKAEDIIENDTAEEFDRDQVIEDQEDKKYNPAFITENAITLSDKIQIIMRFIGEPAEIHKNYDFIHCTNYWSSWDNELYLNQPALEAIISKELVYSGSKYPVCSMIRTRKFIRRGWQINAGQYVKMAFQISELDLSDVAVLQEQLVGVDTVYFSSLIRTLEKRQEPITADYICDILDKMFD